MAGELQALGRVLGQVLVQDDQKLRIKWSHYMFIYINSSETGLQHPVCNWAANEGFGPRII
jgi:hypothetical protein